MTIAPHRLAFGRPRGARGLLPLILGAMGVGRAIIGGIQANQQKQRNKGFINKNYRLASERLDTNQALVRQDTAESLNARGLSPIAGAMRSGAAPSTLGGQVQADTEHQLGLERQDLNNQHDQALAENKAAYNDALVNAGVSGVNTAISAYTASKDAQAFRSPVPSASPSVSPIRSAMLSGGPSPGFAGVDPIDPLGHPNSAWNPNRSTLNGAGLSNADFNTGNG